MSEAAAIDAVLLIAFGGPTAPHEIRPFLEIVTRDRSVPAERLAEVARHYERMPGGRSPLGTLTLAQARGLERALAASGPALPVFVGMRNWHPFLHETLADMTAKGVKRALGIILSPLRTEASWERYRQDVTGARAKVDGAPEVVFARAWGDHPRFIEAVTDRARTALGEIPAAERGRSPLVHVKDFRGRGTATHCAVGEGEVGYERVLPAAVEAGVEWLLVEQDETYGDAMGAAERSLAFVRRSLV